MELAWHLPACSLASHSTAELAGLIRFALQADNILEANFTGQAWQQPVARSI